jgi:hypothetical protein
LNGSSPRCKKAAIPAAVSLMISLANKAHSAHTLVSIGYRPIIRSTLSGCFSIFPMGHLMPPHNVVRGVGSFNWNSKRLCLRLPAL